MNQSTAEKHPTPEPSSVEPEEQEIYAKHTKVYAREVHGIFASLRLLGVVVLLGMYYGIPWLSWNGRQALLFDLPDRKFHIFAWTFWPQDFFYLALLLIIAALSLFFFTALAGRLWCGYACPQTVWTEVFMWIERKVEGDRPQQMKLDRGPWNGRKVRIKATKHVIWVLFAAWTGFTFVGYFTPIHHLWHELTTLSLGSWETFWIIFYSFATWGNAGFLREQVCIYMCPYARFQSAMFDRDTLIISYDENRGEPRGPRKKSADYHAAGLGDCIDCTLCVQVCPTGIDIRNGLQYQCIGCAACIDVCDEVMDKMGYPRGLVRYTTENALEGKAAHILRPRVIVYATLLAVLFGALGYFISQRVPLELDVSRDRNQLYRQAPGGLVENVYNIKVINMENQARRYHLSVEGLKGMKLINRFGDITVPGGQTSTIDVQTRIDPVTLKRASNDIYFIVATVGGEPAYQVKTPSRFVGPVTH
ncbi:MAG: cytochrome c oxidase accessory protein CcoG [Gammaproteobacteria bacterium]